MSSIPASILLLLILMICICQSISWRRRRRRRCSRMDCQVTDWSSWSACSAVQCGKSGTRQRARTVQIPATCGGTHCPSLLEVASCQGTLRVDCQLSSWSTWSECSLLCGGFQTSSRYVEANEQCGGTPCNSTLSKTRGCNITRCLNQRTLVDGKCSCPPGIYGNCSQHNGLDVPCNSPCLLVSTGTGIIALDYNNATIYPIISNLSEAVAIDIHFSLDYIFWSDTAEKNIKRSNINGTNIKILHNNTGKCNGLAVDWWSSQLYWTDEANGTISVSDLEGNNKRVLLSTSPHYPLGIVLDPERGLMFWTVYNFGIKKSTLHGTQNVTLVTTLRSPQGIDLDRQNKLVFWVDEAWATVESVDYDGNNRTLLYRGSFYNLFEVTFFSSYLFVSDRSPSGILKLNASNGSFTSFVPVPSIGQVWGLVTYDSSRQLPGFYCEPLSIPVHGGIKTLCSRLPGYSCRFACERGYNLIGSAVRWCNNDGTWTGTQPRCHGVTCPALSIPTSGVLLGCDTTEMLLDTVCRFSCKNGSQASGSTARRCTDNGTWSGPDLVCTDVYVYSGMESR